MIQNLIILWFSTGASQQTVDENALFKKLFRSYHANLRPVRGVGEVVNVTVDLGLTQIINMVIYVIYIIYVNKWWFIIYDKYVIMTMPCTLCNCIIHRTNDVANYG